MNILRLLGAPVDTYYSLPKTIEFLLCSFESMPSGLFSLKLMFDRSKSESVCDASITRIGDTLSYGFAQTVTSMNDSTKEV